jgi:hypothetical protein
MRTDLKPHSLDLEDNSTSLIGSYSILLNNPQNMLEHKIFTQEACEAPIGRKMVKCNFPHRKQKVDEQPVRYENNLKRHIYVRTASAMSIFTILGLALDVSL